MKYFEVVGAVPVGRLKEDMRLYLETRGLGKKVAPKHAAWHDSIR